MLDWIWNVVESALTYGSDVFLDKHSERSSPTPLMCSQRHSVSYFWTP